MKFTLQSLAAYGLMTLLSITACSGKKEKVVVNRSEKQQKLYEEYSNRFENDPRVDGEVFRVFVSSDFYRLKQTAAEGKVSIKLDEPGNENFSKVLQQFDKIDWASDAVIKVELYPDTGRLSRLRFVRPSGIGELDQMISDDVTRFVFQFKNDVVEPRQFTIHYYIMLNNKVSRKQAIEELKKYAY